jgi:hypothetical protein
MRRSRSAGRGPSLAPPELTRSLGDPPGLPVRRLARYSKICGLKSTSAFARSEVM